MLAKTKIFLPDASTALLLIDTPPLNIDISDSLFGQTVNEYIFFDDLLSNLEGANKQGWKTVWISPDYLQSYKYPFVNKAFPTLKDALDKVNI